MDMGNCDELADCMNFEGGYNCTCRTGYTGDGFTCTGVFFSFHLSMMHRTYHENFQFVFLSRPAFINQSINHFIVIRHDRTHTYTRDIQ